MAESPASGGTLLAMGAMYLDWKCCCGNWKATRNCKQLMLLITHNVSQIFRFAGAVDRSRRCVIGRAIRTKGPPRVPLDLLWLVKESIIFKITLNPLQGVRGDQRSLVFDTIERLKGQRQLIRLGVHGYRGRHTVITILSRAVTVKAMFGWVASKASWTRARKEGELLRKSWNGFSKTKNRCMSVERNVLDQVRCWVKNSALGTCMEQACSTSGFLSWRCAEALIFAFVGADLGALFEPARSPIPLLMALPWGWTYGVSVGNSEIMKKMCLRSLGWFCCYCPQWIS